LSLLSTLDFLLLSFTSIAVHGLFTITSTTSVIELIFIHQFFYSIFILGKGQVANVLGFVGFMAPFTMTHMCLYGGKESPMMCKWVQLCSHKTLFTTGYGVTCL
jgi:hypothetical protein